jgi:hypothetical protein
MKDKRGTDWRDSGEDLGHVLGEGGGVDPGTRKTLQGSRLMRSVADSTSALLLGGDLMVTVFQVLLSNGS